MSSNQFSIMNENEFGSGCTDSTSPGMTRGLYNDIPKTCIYNRTMGPSLQLEYTPWPSTFSQEVDQSCVSVFQGYQGQCVVSSAICALSLMASCAVLIFPWCRGARLLKPRSRPEYSLPRLADHPSFDHWEKLPEDVLGRVFAVLSYENVHQLKAVSKPVRQCIESDLFSTLHHELTFERNVTLTASYFCINDGDWQCAGYDASLRKWRRLPPFTSFLPTFCKPDPDLFKEYLICTKSGIFCMNVSKSSEDRLIVFNPLTRKWKELPPLNHRRNPVLMHLIVDEVTQSYQIIVAGSSRAGDERLSKVTEVFDSCTWEWRRTGDLPGPGYGLNDYQTGVFRDGNLYCIAILDQEGGRGMLRYNMNKGIWLMNWLSFPFPFSTNCTILQLLESWGEIYLFSEQVDGQRVEHCVDRVDEWCDVDDDVMNLCSWNLHNVVRSRKMGSRSLEIYPEHTCISYSEHQLCVFNTIDHSGVVYDVRNYGVSEDLQAPPVSCGFRGDQSFFSLNPMSFSIQPSFRSKV